MHSRVHEPVMSPGDLDLASCDTDLSDTATDATGVLPHHNHYYYHHHHHHQQHRGKAPCWNTNQIKSNQVYFRQHGP